MPRPLIGVCAAVESATYGVWMEEPTVLLPLSYARSIQAAGGITMMIPPHPTASERPDELLDRLDGLILGGGADIDPSSHGGELHPEISGTNPDRDRFEIALALRALARDLPLLGVCRGMQVLNVAVGGALELHLPERIGDERHRPTPGSWAEHEVRLQAGSLAANAAGAERLTVKSHHHQGVADLGDGVEVSGWSADPGDEDTVEAIELPGRFFALGVLWHPEEDPGSRVIPSLVEAAGGPEP